jgi:hypothetical protein
MDLLQQIEQDQGNPIGMSRVQLASVIRNHLDPQPWSFRCELSPQGQTAQE